MNTGLPILRYLTVNNRSDRGVVVSPVNLIDKHRMDVNGDLDPTMLRKYLMYWDMIDFLKNNIIDFKESPNVQYLKEVGVLKRSQVFVHGGGEFTELFSQSQYTAFRNNNRQSPGSWALAQQNIDLTLPNELAEKSRVLEVNLYNSLPIPSPNVSFDDILKFKERRRDELLEFRFALDQFQFELSHLNDSEKAIRSHIDYVQQKLIDIERLMKESAMNRVLDNVKIRMD